MSRYRQRAAGRPPSSAHVTGRRALRSPRPAFPPARPNDGHDSHAARWASASDRLERTASRALPHLRRKLTGIPNPASSPAGSFRRALRSRARSNPQSFPKPEKPSAKEEAPVALSRPLSSKPSAGKKKLARCATRRLGQIHPDHVMLSRCGDDIRMYAVITVNPTLKRE